ncbi:MAG TPA: molecular chaperone HscC [Luteibacter sp.]|jgi:molecular chaperone HscC|nr:molecular chaperone HscC [Luteibacter sp.]
MIAGIDLGTTHSLISVWTADGPRLIPNSLGHVLTPSVVGVDDDGVVLVGAAASGRLLTRPAQTIAAFKRHMGTDRVARLGQHAFRPEELSALVLKSLLADAEAELGTPIEEAVISVPAYFSDAQRKATRNAGELAGIRVERLINEPTAAALAYGLDRRQAESRFLVLDLGGGTFDVSILELFDGVMEVHASAGDNFLGGEDFLDALIDEFCSDTGVRREFLGAIEVARLRDRMERIKRQLSQSLVNDVEITVEGRTHHWSCTADRFEQRCAALITRMRMPIERAIRDASINVGDLDEIVLVGGASRMPMISRLVTRMFGRLPLRHINPDEAIARGTAVMAGLKGRAESLREVVMTDVCPYTLGVEVASRTASGSYQSGLFSPLIERNTVVPASRTGQYYPTQDMQEKLTLRIFQGESPRTVNNILLGEINMPLPPAKAAEMPVNVRFTYDVSGLIQVEATVVATNVTHELVIEQNPGMLSAEEIAERVAALGHLKIHPRDDQANIALIERAERLYEERIGGARQQLGQWLLQFRGELESQDTQRIRIAQTRFGELLSMVEADSPL